MLAHLRYALRVSLKSPGFTLVAVLTLAVGIAASTTVFSWIDSVLVRPLPGVSAGQHLACFETVAPDGEFLTTSYADYRDYRDHLTLVEGLTVAQPRPLSIGEGERTERVWGELVAGNYFAVMGVKPLLGRVFSPDEYGDKQGGYPVVVIGQGLWQSHFNSDPGVIGRTLRVNRQPLTVIGVVPEEFRGSVPGLAFQIWAPAMMASQLNVMPDWMLADRKTRSFEAIARLKPGVTVERAQAEATSISRQLQEQYPRTNEGIGAVLLPIWKGHFGAQSLLLAPLRILMAVCLLVLLIVCSNLAGLLLARSAARQREYSLRMALGAGRTRLIRQLLAETLVMAFLGALIGVPLAMWMGQALGYLVPPGMLPVALDVRMNGDILLFTILVCVVSCVVSGIAPALQTCGANLNDVLKEGGRSGTGGARSQRVRRLLVVGEVALAMLALIGAGLFAESFRNARRINLGFDPQRVLVSHLYLSTAGYSIPDRKLFCERLQERLAAQPGVVAAAYSDIVPLGLEDSWEDLDIEGYVPKRGENMKIHRNVVGPGYFGMMKIPLLDGREFTGHDDEKSLQAMVVNETFTRRFYGGRNPIGRRVRGWGKWFTIVGVARDAKYEQPNEAPRPFFYVSFRQVYREDLAIAFYIRMAGDAGEGLTALRREVRALDPDVAVFNAMPFTESISASLFPQRVAALLLAALGGIALVLAAVGLYSVMAYSVTQRTQEIGIRMALGAPRSGVLSLVVREGMGLAGAGLLAGLAGAAAATQMVSGLLIQVSATDPLIFGGAALFLATVALLASYIPARRATGIDPNAALRAQ